MNKKSLLSFLFVLFICSGVYSQESPEKMAKELDKRGKTVYQIMYIMNEKGVTEAPVLAEAVWKVGRNDPVKIADGLKKIGRPEGETAIALNRISEGPDMTGIIQGLQGAGYDAEEIAVATREIADGDQPGAKGEVKTILTAMDRAGATAREIGTGIGALKEVTVLDLVKALRKTEFEERKIGEIIMSADANSNSKVLFRSLKKVGFSAEETGEILYSARFESSRRIALYGTRADLPLSYLFDLVYSQEDRFSPTEFIARCRKLGVPERKIVEQMKRKGITEPDEFSRVLEESGLAMDEKVRTMKTAGFSSEDVARVLKEEDDQEANRAISYMEQAGYEPEELEKALKKKFWSAEATFEAVRKQVYPGDRKEAARALFSLPFSPNEQTAALNSHRSYRDTSLRAHGHLAGANLTPKETAESMVRDGHTAKEIRNALEENTELNAVEIEDVMNSDPVRKAARRWASAETKKRKIDGEGPEEIARRLKESGLLKPEQIVQNLDDNGWENQSELVRVMTEIGFPPEQTMEALEELEQATKEVIVRTLTDLGFSSKEVASALEHVGVKEFSQVWKIFDEAGLPMKEAGEGLVVVCDGALEKLMQGLKKLGLNRDDVGTILKGFGRFSPLRIVQEMKDADFSLKDIITVLERAEQEGVDTVVDALKRTGFPPAEIGASLLETGYRTRNAIVRAFREAKFSPGDTIKALRKFGIEKGEEFVRFLTDGGFSPGEIIRSLENIGFDGPKKLAEVLRKGAGLVASDIGELLRENGFDINGVAEALKSIGSSPMRIGKALYEAGWKNFKNIKNTLEQIGHTGIDLLKKVLQFIGAKKEELSNIFGE